MEQQPFKTKNVVAVANAHLLHDVFSSFFAPLMPLLMNKLGFNYATAGLLSVIQKIPSLLNPMIGIIADKLVVRSAIIAAPVATILAMSLLGWAPTIPILAILLFTSGLSAAVFHVTAPVLMRQVSGQQIGKGMSFFMFGGEIARTIGPLLITAAISWWGLEGTWRLIPFGLVASLILFINLRTINKKQIQKFQSLEKSNLRKAMKGSAPLFFRITPIILFRGFSKTALTTFLPAYMVSGGHSFKTAAFALAFLELAGAIGALWAGSLSDSVGRKKVLLIIMFFSPLLMFLFTLSNGWTQWLLLGGMGLLFFASTPVFMAMIQDLNSDRPSLMNGIFMTVNFAASSLVALSVGFLADHLGFIITYRLTALLSLLAIPFTLSIQKGSAMQRH